MTTQDISLYHFHSLVLSLSIFVFCFSLTVSCVPSTHQRVRVMCGEVSDVRPLFKVLSVASEVCNINHHSPEALLHPFLSLQCYQKKKCYIFCIGYTLDFLKCKTWALLEGVVKKETHFNLFLFIIRWSL